MEEGGGLLRNPVTMKKTGMKKAFPKNSIFSLAGWLWTAALTARPARNAPTIPGRLMAWAITAATARIASMRTK